MDRRCPWRGLSRARSAVDSAPRDEMISFSPAAGGGWRVGQGPGWGLAHGEERGGGGSVEALGRELGEMQHSWWDSAAPAGGGVGGLQRDGLGEADQQALLLEGWKAWRLAQHRRRTVLTVGSGGRRCFRATRGGARCCGLPWRLAGGQACGRAPAWAATLPAATRSPRPESSCGGVSHILRTADPRAARSEIYTLDERRRGLRPSLAGDLWPELGP